MSNITTKDINELRNAYQVQKALYEQAQTKNEESVSEIRKQLSSITAEEVTLAESLGIDIRSILNTDLNLLKTNKEAYGVFCEKVQNAIEVIFEDAKRKLSDV